MNEMKQRVTNEQATADAICELYCPDCDLAMSKPEEWKCPHGKTAVRKYAADLLDARAIIEKQIELINEMREQIIAVVSTASTPTMKGELVYINNYIEMRELIEKSKGYLTPNKLSSKESESRAERDEMIEICNQIQENLEQAICGKPRKSLFRRNTKKETCNGN